MKEYVIDGRSIKEYHTSVSDLIIRNEVDFEKNDKMIYICLLSFLSKESNSVFPGQRRIAAMSGVNDDTLRKSLYRLQEKKLIRIEERFDEKGKKTTNNYYILDIPTDIIHNFGVKKGSGKKRAPKKKGEEKKDIQGLIAQMGILKYPLSKHSILLLQKKENEEFLLNLTQASENKWVGKAKSGHSLSKVMSTYINIKKQIPASDEIQTCDELLSVHEPKAISEAIKRANVSDILMGTEEFVKLILEEKEKIDEKYKPGKPQTSKMKKINTVDTVNENVYNLDLLD